MSNERTLDFSARRAVALAVLSSLAACGGGGSDPGYTPPAPVAVTAANQDAVSRGAAASVQGSFVSSIPLAGGGSGVLSASRAHAMAAPVARAIGTSAARKQPLETLPCAISGDLTLTADDRDRSGTASPGDVVVAVFSSCQDAAGESLSGTMSITLTAVTVSPRLEFTANASVGNLRLTAPNLSATYNGGLTLAYAQPSATVERTTVSIDDHLTVSVASTSYTDAITLMAGHQIVSTYDSIAGLTTSTATGRAASAAAGGSFAIATLQPVLQYDVDGGWPRSGQLRATGSSGTITLTAIGGGQVRLDLDANNDGSIDQTKTVAWDWLF